MVFQEILLRLKIFIEMIFVNFLVFFKDYQFCIIGMFNEILKILNFVIIGGKLRKLLSYMQLCVYDMFKYGKQIQIFLIYNIQIDSS